MADEIKILAERLERRFENLMDILKEKNMINDKDVKDIYD